MSINKVMITGNLTRDPELRTTQNGMAILSLGVAVNDRKRTQSGEWVDSPNFIDCVMFGRRAESVARYLSKGSKVAIEGSLRYSSWESDGQRRSKVEVAVSEIEFMSKGDAPAPKFTTESIMETATEVTETAKAPEPSAYSDEEIPF